MNREIWDRASPRERRLVLAAAAIVVAAVAWMLVWQPLRTDIERTRAERGRIGALLAAARASVDEGAGLARAPAKANPSDVRSAVARVLAERGVRVPPGALEMRDNRVHVTLPDVRFDTLIAALDALARDDGLRPVDATLTARVDPGTVRAELTFAR